METGESKIPAVNDRGLEGDGRPPANGYKHYIVCKNKRFLFEQYQDYRYNNKSNN